MPSPDRLVAPEASAAPAPPKNQVAAHVAVVDADGTIVHVNQAWRDFAAGNGLTEPNPGLGLNYIEVCERSQLPDAIAVARVLREVLAGQRDGYECEYDCHDPTTGEDRWFSMQIVGIEVAGARHAIVQHTNVTSRRRAEDSALVNEARFRALFDGAQVPMAIMTIDGRFVDVNRAYLAFVGREAGELVGSLVAGLAPSEEVAAQTQQRWEALIATQAPQRVAKQPFRRGDGSLVWARFQESLVCRRDGEPWFVVGIYEDITARHQADALKDEFLGIVSHELRAPLHLLVGQVELMRDGLSGPLTEQQRRDLDDIQQHTDVLTRLIGDLLDMNQLQAGRLSLDPRPVEVLQLLGATGSRLWSLCERYGVSLAWTVETGLPRVLADEQRIAQVLTNLVHNAAKAMRPGGRIQLRAFERDGRVRCEVEDEGPGIAPEDRPHLFERFFRREHEERPGERGLGLGLSICRGIVEAHGGALGVEDAPGGGARFYFTLPAVSEA